MILSLFHVVELLFMLEGAASVNSDGAVIILSSSNITETNYIVKNVDDALELTCVQNDFENNKSVGWVLPESTHKRVLYTKGLNGSMTVTIGHLVENDSGEYKCALQQNEMTDEPCSSDSQCSTDKYPYHTSVYIYVKKKSCVGFQCSPNICILERYVCDGKKDCLNNEDESLQNCGQNPCENKIKCPNGRCIPQEWCCINVKNCTRKWDVNCCPSAKRDKTDSIDYLGSPDHFREHIYRSHESPRSNNAHPHGEMSLLQTIIHIVVGCVLVFVVMCPIIVIAGCRLHTHRRSRYVGTTLSSVPRLSSAHIDRNNPVPLVSYRLPSSNEVASVDELHPFAQWDVERPVETCDEFRITDLLPPPPYSEAVLSRDDDDPPPPYMPTGHADEDSPVKEARMFTQSNTE